MFSRSRTPSEDGRKSRDEQEKVKENDPLAENLQRTEEWLAEKSKKSKPSEIDQINDNLQNNMLNDIIDRLAKLEINQQRPQAKVNATFRPYRRDLVRPTKKVHMDEVHLSRDRIARTLSLFNNIPQFSGTDPAGFLSTINLYVDCLFGDQELSQRELKSVIQSKAHPNVLKRLAQVMDKDVPVWYEMLQLLYDESEDPHTAYTKLNNLKDQGFKIKEYIDECLRLCELVEGENKMEYFMKGINNILPTSLRKELSKYTEQIGRMELVDIIGFLSPYYDEIQHNLDLLGGRGRKRFVNNVHTSNNNHSLPNTSEQTKDNNVNYGGANHINFECRNCGKKHPPPCVACKRCKRTGHNANNCTTSCRLCRKIGHRTVDCWTYRNVEPVSQPCPRCLRNFKREYFHPENLCKGPA